MFDIGFSELMLIAVIALVVIGPERLPKVARTAGHLLGKLQRYVAQVKAELGEELDIGELHKVKSQFQEAAQNWQKAITTEIGKTEQTLNEAVSGREGGAAHSPATGTPPADRPSPELELVSAEPSPQLELELVTEHNPSADKAGTAAADHFHRP